MNKSNRSMRTKTRKLVIISMLSAISIFLGLTGLGFIVIPPVKATIMQIPVIIGAIIEGPIVGAIIGLVFGLFSMYQALVAPTVTSFMFWNPIIALVPRILIGIASYYVYKAAFNGSKKNLKLTALVSSFILSALVYILLTSFLNQFVSILIALIIFIISSFIALKIKYKNKEQSLAVGISAIVGALVNTVGVLGLTYIFYLDRYATALGISKATASGSLIAVGIGNGIPEAFICAIITIPVIIAVKKIRK